MSKREEAVEILKALGLPKAQQNERSALTLLALAGLSEDSDWAATTRPLLRVWDVMSWMRDRYGKDYAANSRETIRRQTIHQFEQARLVDRNPDDPARPVNSGETRYQLTRQAASVLKVFGSPEFAGACGRFAKRHGKLVDIYRRARAFHRVPVVLPDGTRVELTPGSHNELQRLVIEEFAARFAPDACLLYLGDAADKRLYAANEDLAALRIPGPDHGKLPDVVLYDRGRDWLYLIEAVTTHGPVSPKRHAELEAMLADCRAGRIYVTAFADFATFKKYASEVAWESEVWIAERPDHMIHFDGLRFLGPYPEGE